MDAVVPMFPLPGVFLFPGQLLPLHVFEPRYRQMVEDLLDGPGRLVMGTILDDPGGASAGADADAEAGAARPPVLSVAGLGEIAGHQRLPDGRFLLMLVGLARVQIEEVDSARLYRQVRIAAWPDEPGPAGCEDSLKQPLIEAIQARTGFATDKLEGAPTGQLADVLAQCLPLTQKRMAAIFAEPHVAQRAERVLAAHRELS